MGHSLALMMIPHRPFGTPASGPVPSRGKKKKGTSNRGREMGFRKPRRAWGCPMAGVLEGLCSNHRAVNDYSRVEACVAPNKTVQSCKKKPPREQILCFIALEIRGGVGSAGIPRHKVPGAKRRP